ncbi:6-pyruvoyl trahydropterin synthase family protein [Tuwongella immobilis]|uniref:6-carboxy-5,6,7,8-tetrahydropterin synthase n=1 Tax=Tuwongella immobilis TaxID=692036 RepID=A0A6C2YJH1_9BACT|nr:6-carboxytetrahydropterin synthase [Tuwongella immobilis]VIP01514.1 6-pyruvoyl-tetrahydropterin synthase OS=Singulisphaera acidiphila (strain ATCC BAA-1392 / DSM 18658 / VKM B-2454 / MOB10) GN=Sinac_1233 PE=4 SV=1: PTPS [Tuwongella immobilis]VTR98634.1 6-pyruvoyl-tetrahydropterin synthase OS=Singulisphaera acidiphila (strain ATCC BAA-1392 / DSM 18658 / VKM B-2454 / MOB10) GN=Sinac_1233 PE=4 SV=1: PTPS [Tuwongella immobilis]
MKRKCYKVHVTKDYLVFCCAHFITYDGDQCEKLHGHNYRVAVELEGALDENHYVFDFVSLKKRMRAIVDELDHHMLLATKNPLIRVEEQGHRVQVRYQDREWIFPRSDCVLLPIENTTAELLAKHIAERLVTVLREQHHYTPDRVHIEVEETFGQSAVFSWELESSES